VTVTTRLLDAGELAIIAHRMCWYLRCGAPLTRQTAPNWRSTLSYLLTVPSGWNCVEDAFAEWHGCPEIRAKLRPSEHIAYKGVSTGAQRLGLDISGPRLEYMQVVYFGVVESCACICETDL
jgi:hypothetical protein